LNQLLKVEYNKTFIFLLYKLLEIVCLYIIEGIDGCAVEVHDSREQGSNGSDCWGTLAKESIVRISRSALVQQTKETVYLDGQ
jgi:hypothetical protein